MATRNTTTATVHHSPTHTVDDRYTYPSAQVPIIARATISYSFSTGNAVALIMVVYWSFHAGTMEAPWKHKHWSTTKVPWMNHASMEKSWRSHRSTMEARGKHHGSPMEAPWTHHGSSYGSMSFPRKSNHSGGPHGSKIFHANIIKLPWNQVFPLCSHGSPMETSWTLPHGIECFHGSPMEFPWKAPLKSPRKH